MWSVATPLPEGADGITDAELRAELLGLFGIGGETADDMMLYVFSRRTFVADTYARRLFAFLGFDAPAGYPAFHKAYAPVVLDTGLDVADLQEFHGAHRRVRQSLPRRCGKKRVVSPVVGDRERLLLARRSDETVPRVCSNEL